MAVHTATTTATLRALKGALEASAAMERRLGIVNFQWLKRSIVLPTLDEIGG